ncbi:nitroreductase [Sphingobium subterraneum]|uniref:Nitroreductase n=2 Tax=Sphingobium subterraneum TaxID=627688 RepID=A0A841IZ16_9SPHN|nr:nitroreductase [Sphingobium subterraneum]
MDIILKAAVRAPDHGRLAPWRLTVIEGAAREKLGQAYVNLKRRLSPDQPSFDQGKELMKAFRAPTIIAVGVSIQEDHKVPAVEQIVAAGAAVQNMFLAAHALGLGAMWKTGDLAYDDNMKSLLGLKASDAIVALLFVGTPPKLPPAPVAELKGCVSWL